VWIQGRYKGTKWTKGLAATNKLAVGGPFLRGRVIVVGTLDAGAVVVDDQEVLTDFPSTYSLAGLGTLRYNGQGDLPDDAAGVWDKKVVHMDLPLGVQVTVFRWKNYVDFRIKMPAQPGQDGACGTANSDPSDDTAEAIQSRVGAQVAPNELLFKRPTVPRTSDAVKHLIAICQRKAATFARAQQECNQNKACIMNVCYGSNSHALRFAKSMGL